MAHHSWKRTLLLASFVSAAGATAMAQAPDTQSQVQQTGSPVVQSPYAKAPSAMAEPATELPQIPANENQQAAPKPLPLPAPAEPAAAPCGPSPTFLQRCKANLQACFIGYAAEFQAPPLGHFVYEHARTQVENGEAARMVLHHFDFIEGSDRLNTHGKDELARIANSLPRNFYPVVIERSPDAPALAEARRAAVFSELAKGPFPIPSERVVIGQAIALDLHGTGAIIVNQSMQMQTRTSGAPIAPGIQSSVGTNLGAGSNIPGGTGPTGGSPP